MNEHELNERETDAREKNKQEGTSGGQKVCVMGVTGTPVSVLGSTPLALRLW